MNELIKKYYKFVSNDNGASPNDLLSNLIDFWLYSAQLYQVLKVIDTGSMLAFREPPWCIFNLFRWIGGNIFLFTKLVE